MKSGKTIKYILALACCLMIVLGALSLDRISPSFEAEEKKPVSAMAVSNQRLVYDREAAAEADSAAVTPGSDTQPEEEETPPEETEEEEPEEETEPETEPEDVPQDLPEDLPQPEESGQWPDNRPNPNAGEETEPQDDQGDPDSQDKQPGGSGEGEDIPEEKPSENPGEGGGQFENYFTTSIINEDVCDHPQYTFTIQHRQPQLKPLGISVKVNGAEETYRGGTTDFRITLAEGANTILVQVIYQEGDKQVTASRNYTLYYAPGQQVVIVCSLENVHQVSEEQLTFTAYGVKDGRRMGATVKVNNHKITGKNDTFTANLELGKENTIAVSAGGRHDRVTKVYKVLYTTDVFEIRTTISSTVIRNETHQSPGEYEDVTVHGDTEEFKFRVSLNGVTGKEQLRLIKFGFDTIQPGGDGWYSVELNQRDPEWLILFYTDSNGERQQYRYLLRFQRNGDATTEDRYPTVTAMVEIGDSQVNLENGMVFKNPNIITNINARSWDNEQLYYNNFSVSVNGRRIQQHGYQSGSTFGYDTYLTQEGENTITVTVTDNDGYAVTKNWRVYYEPGNVHVTVSVEASTVGLGYLVPPTQVEVPGGTDVMTIVTDLLSQNGYGYQNAGGYYLSAVTRPGICNGFHIDPELMDLIVKDAMDDFGAGTDPQPASMDGLCEMDFYRWSGWMYSYNGSYPGYGMNVCKPQDGAVIRVRYTLAMGKDIGGYTATQGEGYGVTPGNYYKEW